MISRQSHTKLQILIVAIVAVASFTGAVYFTKDPRTEYVYTVKAEQVYDSSNIEYSNATNLENLDKAEKDLIYEAFKKSDHFFWRK